MNHAGTFSDPGKVNGLRVARIEGGGVRLSWGESCSDAEEDFAVYAGGLGSFAFYDPLTCSTVGRTTYDVESEPTSRFFLVVPRSADREGSYGPATGHLRSPAAPGCLPQEIGECGG